MATPRNVFGQLAEVILEGGAVRATKFLSPTETVRAKRVTYHGRIDKRERRTIIVYSIGRPNYEEREFIKLAKEAGEKFPIQKIQIKWPKK